MRCEVRRVTIDSPPERRRRLSRRLFRAAGPRNGAPDTTLGAVLAGLGDRSFGWLILVFSLVNLLPMPIGGTLITAIPLVIVTLQMALGLHSVRLPGRLTRWPVNRKAFQKRVLWLGPVIRQIERVVRRRVEFVFAPQAERLLGIWLLCVSIVLFLPIPLSGYLPAFALFLSGVGLVERDGLVTLVGAGLGLVAMVVTAGVVATVIIGAHSLGYG
jgi:hypothetical protein